MGLLSGLLGVADDLLEGLRVDVSEDVSQGAEGVLEHVVPVSLGEVHNDRDEDREGLGFVVLEDAEEEVVLEEAHGPVGHLEMRGGDALDQSLEELLDEWLQFGDVADVQDLQELLKEVGFLSVVGEWPVLQQPFDKLEIVRLVGAYWECEEWVLRDEKHRASEELAVELLAGLDLVQWDDDGLEEVDVLLSKRDGEAGDDRGEDVEQFRSSVELEVLVDEGVEAVSDGLPDHLPPRDKLGVQPMEDVLQVLPLLWLLTVEELEELLDEFVSDEGLEALHIGGVVDDQLEEELINRLEVRPGRVDDNLLLLDTDVHAGGVLLDHRKRPEDVLLDHLHDVVQMGDDEVDNVVLVCQQIAQLRDVFKPLVLLSDHFPLIVEIECLRAELDFLKEQFLGF